jgi:sulfur-oxidizing protein SoxX
MRIRRRSIGARTACAAALLTLTVPFARADMPQMELNGNAEAGKAIAMDRSKGNCIACHLIVGGEAPGAIGPALIAIAPRFQTKEAVAKQIWDATVRNPEAVMPPFGKHEILTEQEFKDVVEYVWSL